MITIREIIDLVIMVFVIGYIFSGFIKKPRTELELYKKSGFNWQDLQFAILITAPAIVLHELAHKFVAIFFGLTAVFKIFWQGLGLAVFLKLIHSPFLIIAPGYVLISQNATIPQTTIIAFAGPLVNLILFFVAGYILNHAKNLTRTQATALYITKKLNLLLFIFNMLPIPPLDGSKVFYGLYKLIF